ncbi:hypothetical protein CEXT_549851 [Caerostris extrusa]|uniref:Transmembrane protein n=1 Tax=Caerostris extrusa TaxID=172846 RepID=A0AAV4SDD8_CAEEX|nr:hypothetical protein CEXT_549851 [Caerostris extrusa]
MKSIEGTSLSTEKDSRLRGGGTEQNRTVDVVQQPRRILTNCMPYRCLCSMFIGSNGILLVWFFPRFHSVYGYFAQGCMSSGFGRWEKCTKIEY